VATKNAAENMENGIMELRVPSSTTCVATMALASKVQNNVATRPACMAVSTTNADEPWVRNEPVVINWKGRVKRYKQKNIRSSTRPTAALRLPVKCIKDKTTKQLRPQARILAMLPREPSFTFGIPHTGLTPTGAVVVFWDKPCKTDSSVVSNWR